MCGIAGCVRERPLEPERIERTLALMRHRGPDNAEHRGFATPSGRHVDLLHTRLEIIDLDARANQPFQSAGGSLVFNGELYNYLELRSGLLADVGPFATSSDTEVLARLLDEHGADGLDDCEGMWALARYRQSDGSLLLSRDRFGEKPLYLYESSGDLYFASEVKLLAAMAATRLEPDLDQLRRYLVNGYKSLYKQPSTFFRGVRELAPGTSLEIDANGKQRQRAYWQPEAEIAEQAEMSFDLAAAGVRERLIRSVELRLRADVPLAFLMSGGVDSIALISIASRVLGHQVHGFTIMNEDRRYDEAEMVALAVDELGVDHTEVPTLTANFVERLRGLVRHHDAPVYTIAHYAHYLLLEAIGAHGYKVSVSGTAADELFSGYFDHHLAYLYEVRDDPARLAQAKDEWAGSVKPFVRNPYLQDPEYFIKQPDARDHIYLNAERFAGFLHRGFDEPFGERRYTAGLLRNRMLNELFCEAVPVILHEDDLNAMLFSVENRSPYLDRELFEFSRRIPTPLLVRDGRAKAVLRAALDGIAPAAILENRRKVGFNAPINSFLDTGDPEVRDELLADSPIFEHVRRDRIAELIDAEELPNSDSKFLFYFLNSKLFLEEFA